MVGVFIFLTLLSCGDAVRLVNIADDGEFYGNAWQMMVRILFVVMIDLLIVILIGTGAGAPAAPGKLTLTMVGISYL